MAHFPFSHTFRSFPSIHPPKKLHTVAMTSWPPHSTTYTLFAIPQSLMVPTHPAAPFSTQITSRSLTQLQQFLRDQVVLHHADHEFQNLDVFCPLHYFRGCLTTPQLFKPLPHFNTDQLRQFLTTSFRPLTQSLSRKALEKRQNSHQLC